MALEYMILGLLRNGPLSGYDLNKQFSYVAQFFWSADQAQIYRTLYRMRDQGWVQQEAIPQDKAPDKKLYHLTPSGRDELLKWLLQTPQLGSNRQPWLGQLFFSDLLEAQQILENLRALRKLYQVYLDELESRLMGVDFPTQLRLLYQEQGQVPTGLIALQYGIEQYRFYLEWIGRTLEEIQALQASRG